MDRFERERVDGLLVRLADGDRGAFDPLYDMLLPKVLRFAERAVGSSDAPDIAQTVLFKVFERAAAFEPDRDGVAWIFGIAAFECRTYRTRARRRRETAFDAEAEVAADVESPEDSALARDIERAFRDTVGDLTASDRGTLGCVLSGERPDVPPATFRKRVERAFARFRHAWRGEAR